MPGDLPETSKMAPSNVSPYQAMKRYINTNHEFNISFQKTMNPKSSLSLYASKNRSAMNQFTLQTPNSPMSSVDNPQIKKGEANVSNLNFTSAKAQTGLNQDLKRGDPKKKKRQSMLGPSMENSIEQQVPDLPILSGCSSVSREDLVDIKSKFYQKY